jgi:hypothetical protein
VPQEGLPVGGRGVAQGLFGPCLADVEDGVGELPGQPDEVVRAVGVQGRAADDGHDGRGQGAAGGQFGAAQDLEAGRVPEGLPAGKVVQGLAALGGQRIVGEALRAVEALGDEGAQGEMAAAGLGVVTGLVEAVGQGVQQRAAVPGRQGPELVKHLLPASAPGAAAGVHHAQRLVGDAGDVAVGDPVAQPVRV